MKKILFLLAGLSLITFESYSQLTLNIDSIKFSNVIDTVPKVIEIIGDSTLSCEYNSNMGEGPTLEIYCSFINNSSNSIDIDIIDYSTFILFEYNGTKRERYASPYNISSGNNYSSNKFFKHAVILPNKKYSFYLSTPIFLLEKDIIEKHKERLYKDFEVYRYDYTNAIYQIVSTLRAKYVGDNINLISDFISIVEKSNKNNTLIFEHKKE